MKKGQERNTEIFPFNVSSQLLTFKIWGAKISAPDKLIILPRKGRVGAVNALASRGWWKPGAGAVLKRTLEAEVEV
jgi:hypothetical protein